jgi:hypothetical protein
VLGNLDPILITLQDTDWVADVDTNTTTALKIFQGLLGDKGVDGWDAVITFMEDPLVNPADYLTLISPNKLEIDLYDPIPNYLIFSANEKVTVEFIPVWMMTTAPFALGRQLAGHSTADEGFEIQNKATARISGSTSEWDIDNYVANPIFLELFDATWDNDAHTNGGKTTKVMNCIEGSTASGPSVWTDIYDDIPAFKDFMTKISDTVIRIDFITTDLTQSFRLHNENEVLTIGYLDKGAHDGQTHIDVTDGSTSGSYIIYNERT